MVTKRSTIQLALSVEDEINDNILKTQYGTNIEEYMGKEHTKEIYRKIDILRNEFKKIGKHKNDKISIKELVNFFNKQNDNSHIINENYMKNVFKILNSDPNVILTVNDFVTNYVKLEESIKIKNIKIEKAINELSTHIKFCSSMLSQYQNEIEDTNGLTENASISLYILALGNNNDTDDIDYNGRECYCKITYGNKIYYTRKKSDKIFNEKFEFNIQKYDDILIIDVFQNGFFGDKKIGEIRIELKDLEHDTKIKRWCNLYDDGSYNNINNNIENEINNSVDNDNKKKNDLKSSNKIYLQVLYIKSKEKYYQKLIDIANEEIKFLKESFESTEFYLGQAERNFGIIYSGNLKPLLESKYVYVDTYISKIESERKDIFYKKKKKDNNDDNNKNIGFLDKIKLFWNNLISTCGRVPKESLQ